MRTLACELRKTVRTPAFYVIAAFGTALAAAFALMPQDAQGGPLIMVAGDAPETVGGAIGFIGNLVDPARPAASAMRTALCPTVLWAIAAAAFAAHIIAGDATSPAAAVSRAKGASWAAFAFAKAASVFAAIAALYLASTLAIFAFKAWQCAAAPSLADIALFAAAIGANIVFLCAFAAAAMLLAAAFGGMAAATIALFVLYAYTLAAYPGAYALGGEPQGVAGFVCALTPTPHLFFTCSLSLAAYPLAQPVASSLAMAALSVGGAALALHVKEA